MRMTKTAIDKALEVIEKQNPKPYGLRVGVIGGGCSGFQYNMQFENKIETRIVPDKVYEFEGSNGNKLKIFVDQASMLYLKNCEIDYVETLEVSGFKFN